MSTIDALHKLTEKYATLGKKVELMHLSEDCRLLLHNAKGAIVVNIVEDPTYRVMPRG
ncbi:MAG: hypothetical protein ACTJHT_09040 [Sphingobacterium sp.]|nr:Sulfate permease [Sphingobacterium sp. JB170]